MYRELIENMADNYGSDCDIRFPDVPIPFTTKAFISPMNYKYKNFAGISYGVDGSVSDRTYRYIGKITPDLGRLPKGSVIVCDGKTYRVDSSDLYSFQDEAIYCRATLKLCEGGAYDD